jgi:hypothetical protein
VERLVYRQAGGIRRDVGGGGHYAKELRLTWFCLLRTVW